VPCPYAERRGAAVYCRAAGRKVNPLAFPCLTDRYERCRYYKPPGEAGARGREAEEAARPRERGEPETLGLTLDGRRPRSCRECIYYGSRTGVCLLLGVTVEDPERPPCARR